MQCEGIPLLCPPTITLAELPYIHSFDFVSFHVYFYNSHCNHAWNGIEMTMEDMGQDRVQPRVVFFWYWMDAMEYKYDILFCTICIFNIRELQFHCEVYVKCQNKSLSSPHPLVVHATKQLPQKSPL